MRRVGALVVLGFFWVSLSAADLGMAGQRPQNANDPVNDLNFAEKLKIVVPEFDSAGLPMAEIVVHLAYKYKLPTAIEYADRNSLRKPLQLKLRNRTVHQIILAVVSSIPAYSVDFAEGLVDVYSSDGRRDKSNPLNVEIPRYDANALDTRFADAELFCDLTRQLQPHSGCGGSVAGGQWGNRKITLFLKGMKVYEILNAIVAQNGQALWVPAPQQEHTTSITRDFWYIYPLDAPFETSAVEQLQSLVRSAT